MNNKVARAAHIKPNTQGSSNEISFSVLDAVVRDSSPGDAADSFGKIPLFTMGNNTKAPSDSFRTSNGSSSTRSGSTRSSSRNVGKGSNRSSSPWVTPVDEVRRRKASRNRRRYLVFGVVAALVLLIVSGTATAVLSFLHTQDEKQTELIELLQTIEDCDNTLLPFDAMVTNQITQQDVSLEFEGDLSRRYSQMDGELNSVVSRLEDCKAKAEELEDVLASGKDKECANEAIVTINARLNMLDVGRSILNETLPAYIARGQARKGWESLLAGDGKAREALEAAATMNTTTVTASKTLSEEALNNFMVARDSFNAAATWAEPEMLPYITYSQLRLDAQTAAVASDEAYLARDRQTMIEQNDIYNSLDEQAVSMAENVSTDPCVLINRAIETILGNSVAVYTSERQKAGNADVVLRDYLSSLE